MGRPRGGKAKRPASQAAKTEDADAGSGNDDAVVSAYKRTGRPQKHFKSDDTDEEDDDKVKVEATEGSDGTRPGTPITNGDAASVENESGGKKRRRRQWKRGSGSSAMEEEQVVDGPVRHAGFRHHGSRRKSTPRRAAEAGVACK